MLVTTGTELIYPQSLAEEQPTKRLAWPNTTGGAKGTSVAICRDRGPLVGEGNNITERRETMCHSSMKNTKQEMDACVG